MKERPSGKWYYSVRPWIETDGSWCSEWIVSASSARDAAALVQTEQDLRSSTFWVVPMTSPDDWTSIWDVPQEREAEAEIFVNLWDEEESEKVEL